MVPKSTQILRGWISWIPLGSWMGKIITQQINSPLDRRRSNLFQQGNRKGIEDRNEIYLLGMVRIHM